MSRGTPLDNNVLHGATIAYGRFLVEGTTKDNCELWVYLHAFSFFFPLRKKDYNTVYNITKKLVSYSLPASQYIKG